MKALAGDVPLAHILFTEALAEDPKDEAACQYFGTCLITRATAAGSHLIHVLLQIEHGLTEDQVAGEYTFAPRGSLPPSAVCKHNPLNPTRRIYFTAARVESGGSELFKCNERRSFGRGQIVLLQVMSLFFLPYLLAPAGAVYFLSGWVIYNVHTPVTSSFFDYFQLLVPTFIGRHIHNSLQPARFRAC
jgi:hypothetical protein